MSQHVVCHIEKVKGALTTSGQEIDREFTPNNADPNRANLNEQLVETKSHNLTDDVNARIKEGHKGKKALRKDAVKAFKIILSGSHDQMKEIEKDPKALKAWKEANLKFLEENFGGSSNIVRATLHRDETTPHIHAVIVPIVNERLAAKRLLDGPKDIAQLQTKYAEYMKPFGLSRGKEGSTAKHTDIREYYGRVNKQENLFPEVTIPVKGILEKEESFQKRAQKELTPIFDAMDKAKRINGQLKGDINRLVAEKKELEEKLSIEFKRGAKDLAQAIKTSLLKLNLKLDFNPERMEFKIEPIKEQQQKPQQEIKKGGISL